MTIGLFIALCLEASIEYLHHKHMVREARETIRQEIEQNQKKLQKDISSAATQSDRMKAALATMQRLRAHPQEHGSIEFNWNNIDLNDAAWRSARDTGALGYMPYAEVRDDASLYALQTSVTEQMTQLTSREFEVVAPITLAPKGDFSKIPEPQFNNMLLDAARMQLDFDVLGQLMKGLDASYTDTLKHH